MFATVPNPKHYKIGIDEMPELRLAMFEVLKPILVTLNNQQSATDRLFEFSEAEYKSRDGFIPYSHNHGGVQITGHIPEFCKDDYSWISFGEHDDDCKYHECNCDDDGLLDAYLVLWLKYEGLDENGVGQFYIVVSAGNEDAPYFRIKNMPTVFESSFEASSVDEFKRRVDIHVANIIRMIKKG